MARKRMIDPSIWQSEDFSKLSSLAKIVFIGLFSLADDEGRGRANAIYLKSSLFPYEEGLRSTDIEKTLSEISSNMSVIFYSYNESNYYELTSWDRFQKIDRATPSQIIPYDESNKDIRRILDEPSTNTRRALAPNRIEENKNKIEKNRREFIAPSLEEVQGYIAEKNLKVDAKKFYDYFTEGNWVDSKGNKVKNWKQKLQTWNGYTIQKKEEQNKNAFHSNGNENQYKSLEQYYSNL